MGDLDSINKKYKIITADPPWTYQDKSKSHGGGAESHYKTMTVEDICNLPVSDLADEDCILFIWGTWTHNREIHQVIDSWGFEYKTIGFVWVKRYNNGKHFLGMGRWSRANTEYCLIAVKGKPKRVNASVRQVVESVPEGHSKKPNEVMDRIVTLVGDLPRIELFARNKRDNWDSWGNEVA
jgi:N6-adenosine-specific RNA methylase IME4